MGERTKGKPVVGIVGGIGAGKSTVAAEIVRMGGRLIDADKIGHEVLGDPEVSREIRRRWGDGVFAPDGRVDRQALGREAFSDRRELDALSRITHPLIRRGIQRRIAEAVSDPAARLIVLDAAVLFEAGWDDLCTHVVFVDAPDEARAKRAAAQRGWDQAAWRGREIMQISLDKKRRKCDYTIDNSSSVSCLQEQTRQLLHKILRPAECAQ